MPFIPPKTTDAFRRFVVLDGPEVLAALSALDGGAVDEILTRKTGGTEREVGADLGVQPAKVRGKRGKTERVEEEMRRVRTEHSAASTLIDGLRARDALGRLEGALDSLALDGITPGVVFELRAEVSLHPVFQIDAAMTSFLANAQSLGQAQAATELREVMPLMRALMGTGEKDGKVLLDFATGPDQAARLVAVVQRAAVQVPFEDLTGHFSAVVQVDEILSTADEALLTLRAIRGVPPGKQEREGIVEGGQALIGPAVELGVRLTSEDLLMPPPLVMLRPIAIWR